jgi:hypothetical protein
MFFAPFAVKIFLIFFIPPEKPLTAKVAKNGREGR